MACLSIQPTLSVAFLPLCSSPTPLPGVYGRVAHLADIRDKRYVLAVTAAMGKDFDGIIVKDGEAATAALRWHRDGAAALDRLAAMPGLGLAAGGDTRSACFPA